MTYILHIETSTKVCSVALSNNGTLLKLKEEVSEKYIHAERLTILIKIILKEANLDIKSLSAISVSKGPGSYTGLRIGVSTAKGLSYALNIPLIAIDTLKSLSCLFYTYHKLKSDELIIPMIDARRDEVYTAVFKASGERMSKTSAEVITLDYFNAFSKYNKIHLLGDGCNKFRLKLTDIKKIIFHDSILCSASSLVSPSFNAFNEKQFENTAYFEPFYLKDFKAF